MDSRNTRTPFPILRTTAPLHPSAPLRNKQARKHTTEDFTRRYTEIWNTLPTERSSNRTLISFKKKLKKHLLQKK
jgi:hypothetical protein